MEMWLIKTRLRLEIGNLHYNTQKMTTNGTCKAVTHSTAAEEILLQLIAGFYNPIIFDCLPLAYHLLTAIDNVQYIEIQTHIHIHLHALMLPM